MVKNNENIIQLQDEDDIFNRLRGINSRYSSRSYQVTVVYQNNNSA